jgi:hypothetical protein
MSRGFVFNVLNLLGEAGEFGDDSTIKRWAVDFVDTRPSFLFD